jgi:hypothetical protein
VEAVVIGGFRMECTLVVPHKTDISIIEREYPDICNDEIHEDGDRYFIGKPNEQEPDFVEGESDEWLTYDEAIAFCGYCEGSIDGADAVIDGNGEWAMSMLCRTDFTGYAGTTCDIAAMQRCSNIWNEAFERGKGSR